MPCRRGPLLALASAAVLAAWMPAQGPERKEFVSQATEMKFVRIPKGTFMMGSPSNEKDRYENETQHEVTLSRDFDMGMYEVTRGQFRLFVEDTGYKTEAEEGDGAYGWDSKGKEEYGKRKDFIWQTAGYEQTDDHPVVNVSWNDAARFAEWLSKKDGQAYRLPTEAEWEYACRGGTTTKYYFGSNPEELPKYANVADGTARRLFPNRSTLSAEDGYVYTAPVGRFKPNSFGLYDMCGNVFEWCQDWMGDYPAGSVTDPTGPSIGLRRVYRGGSWVSPRGMFRSADRNGFKPSFRSNDLGFRIVRVVTKP
jgi:formylglycine-generating enzyme required for sulfatase activity